MIEYRSGGTHAFFNMFRMKGSVFPVSFLVAFPCTVIAGVLKYFDVIEEQDVLTNNTAWSGFSFLVGFLVVFRTSQAYSRFWDGAASTHRMRAEWCDAASAIVAFTKYSKVDEALKSRFNNTLIRLFSLIHAMALGELEGNKTREARYQNLEIIDAASIDSQSWRALEATEYKVTLVFQWIQGLIVENISTGVLSIPPPILTRVFQELGNGMVAHHEAVKITEVPFPFPYAQACDGLLIMHWLLTPVITVQYTASVFSAVIFCFVQVFILWSLTNIAIEIENPFGDDANDLNAEDMQNDLNVHLLLILNPAASRSPYLMEDSLVGESLTISQTAGPVKRVTFRSYSQVCRMWDDVGYIDVEEGRTAETPEHKSEPTPPRTAAAEVSLARTLAHSHREHEGRIIETIPIPTCVGDMPAAEASADACSCPPQTSAPARPEAPIKWGSVDTAAGRVRSADPFAPAGKCCASSPTGTPAAGYGLHDVARFPYPPSAQDANRLPALGPRFVSPSPSEFTVAADEPRIIVPGDASQRILRAVGGTSTRSDSCRR